MKIFKRIGNRFIFFNKWSFCLKGKVRKFVTLGVNCFPRTKLTKFGIKARKSDGELSYPFDLCFIPLKSVNDILADNFSDYYEGLYFDESKNIWVNSKYDIFYWHDKNIDYEAFKVRYDNRIDNFRNVLASSDELVFISVVFSENFNLDLYNSVYTNLAKYCKSDFNYLVVNIVQNPTGSFRNIGKNIYYCEIKEPCEDYKNLWTQHSLDKSVPEMYSFYEKYIETVLYVAHL